MMGRLSEKIRRIIEFIVFMGIILVLFCKLTWLFRSNSGEAREDIQGFKNQGNIDVVLYGGSNLLRYYQPLEAYHEKGFTSYNYATTAYRADLLKFFMEESRSSNEAVLYVCDIRTLLPIEGVSDELALRTWSDSVEVFAPARIKGITTYLFNRDWQDLDVFSYYFDIAEYHSNYEALARPYQWQYLNLTGIYNVDKGFNAKHSMGHIPFERPEAVDECRELTEQQARVLDELLNYCDKEELSVLFIVCPYIITKSDWEIFNTCADIIQERGYDFVNFNCHYDEIGFDFETDFFDVNHINYLGAEKYTEYLLNYLSDNYDLPDHRGDIQYAKWDEDYEAYALLQKEWKDSIMSIVDQHLEAKETGEKINSINDFLNWFEYIQNENYTVIIVKKDYLDAYNTHDLAFDFILAKWGIDEVQNNYIGIWQGQTALFYTNSNESFEGEIGVDGGRGMLSCRVSTGDNPQILINETDYYNDLGGIQIVVFDNNYQKVIDNVNIYVNENGISLVRQELPGAAF